MPIPVVCPHCQGDFRASDGSAGKRVKCRACQNPFVVTLFASQCHQVEPIEASESKVYDCPHCRSKVSMLEWPVDGPVVCPRCEQQFLINSLTNSTIAIYPQIEMNIEPPARQTDFENWAPTRRATRQGRRQEQDYEVLDEIEPRRDWHHPPFNGLGIASFVLSVCAFVISIVPCIGIGGIPDGALGLVFGLVGFVISSRNNSSPGFSIAGSVVGGLALMIGIM